MRGDSAFLWTALLAVCTAAGSGCAGRSEFRQGRDLDLRGDLRGAYRAYHSAHLLSGSPRHLEARNRAGALIAAEIRAGALGRERSGDIESAADAFISALEYRPGCAEMEADLWRVLERIESIGEAERRAQDFQGSWESHAILADLRRERAARPDVDARAAAAALDWIDLRISGLLGRWPSFSGESGAGNLVRPPALEILEIPSEGARAFPLCPELPADAASLEIRVASWLDLLGRMDDLAQEEAGERGAMGLAVPLERRRLLAETALWETGEAFQAEVDGFQGSRREAAGDLEGAVTAYKHAFGLWPWRRDLREACDRALEALILETSSGVLRAMARKDWDGALRELGCLERFTPGSETVRRRTALCRKEIQEALQREGRGLKERGLPGNALCVLLRLRTLALAGAETDGEIQGLENEILRRLRPDVDVIFPHGTAEDPAVQGGPCPPLRTAPVEDQAKDPSPFGKEEMLCILEGAVREEVRLRKLSDSGAASTTPRAFIQGAWSPGLPLEILDLAFDFHQKREMIRSAESRFISDVRQEENPEWTRVRDELLELSAQAEEARKALAAASLEGRAEAQARLLIIEGKARRVASDFGRIPTLIPVTVWKSEFHPVSRVMVEARLSVKARIDGECQALEVRLAAGGHEVAGDVGRGVAPDRPELPTRSEALKSLAPRIASEIAVRVQDRKDARRRMLLEEAKAHLAEDAFEPAVEDLVAFICAERVAGPGPQCAEAVDLLRKITGCEMPVTAAKAAERTY